MEAPERVRAPWRVAAVEVLDGGRLRVRFVDGTLGEVRMESFLASPGGADLAPDAMYDAIRERGFWTLE